MQHAPALTILLELCVLISTIDSFALLYTINISMDVKIGYKGKCLGVVFPGKKKTVWMVFLLFRS
jgi:hypothetical protein